MEDIALGPKSGILITLNRSVQDVYDDCRLQPHSLPRQALDQNLTGAGEAEGKAFKAGDQTGLLQVRKADQNNAAIGIGIA